MEGAKSGRVKVVSVLSVVSSKPIGPGKFHKLSKLDHEMGLRRVQTVFYYESNPFCHGPMSDQLDNLRASLSQLLNDYPVVTGRLTRDPDDGSWQIKCNDAGVRMLRAKVSTTLDEWLRSDCATDEQDLMVWEDMPQDPSFWSPFRIQINNFECGGLAIGLTCTHMHADLTSAIMLIKSWTDAHHEQPLSYPPTMNLPTPLPLPAPPQVPPSSSPEQTKGNPHHKMGTLSMKFSSKSIEKCLSELAKQCPSATPFDVLVALFWSRMVNWTNPESDSDRNHSISICTDLRNRSLDRKIPLGYFGNALQFSRLSIPAGDFSGGGMGKLAGNIHGHVTGLKVGEDSVRPYSGELVCINMEHLVEAENGQGIMYSAIFDKGSRPVHVSFNVQDEGVRGLIIVAPSPEPGRGRTVTVTLPEEQIRKLAKDDGILEFEPVICLKSVE